MITLALAASIGAASFACGGDDSATPGSSAAGTGGSAAGLTILCDSFTELGGLDAQAPQDPAEFGAFTRDVALPVVDRITTHLPANLSAEGHVIHSAFTMLAETGDLGVVMTPEVTEAKAAIGARVFDTCGGSSVEAVGMDYAFTGVPERLSAGSLNLRFENRGREEHELIVLRRHDGVTADFATLTANGPAELFGGAEFIGVTWGAPQETAYARMDLQPGTYFFVCTLPTAGDQADPHFHHGMHQTVVVS
jgi:hypothetical protein